MGTLDDWPLAPVLRTERLSLEPLRVDHADEMAPLLDDPRLHGFTGDAPRTLDEMRWRYEQQVSVWSVDGSRRWLNWIARDDATGQVVGGVQAIVVVEGDAPVAELAWVIGSAHQRKGYAREAAAAMAAWLRDRGAVLIADIHPANEASMAVARSVGLISSGEVVERGDVRWRG